MKILQINSDFQNSSTGKITESLHHMLLDYGQDSFVCYGRNTGINDERVFPTISNLGSKFQHLLCNIVGDPYSCCFTSTERVINNIEKIKPDIVHLQCINGYFTNIYKLLTWLGDHEYNTVLTLHAEFMYTGGCDHAFDCEKWLSGCNDCNGENNSTFKKKSPEIFNKFQKSFSHFKTDKLIIVSVSDWLKTRAMQSPILKRFKHYCVMNGVNTDVFHFIEHSNNYFKTLEYDFLLFHVSAGFNPDSNDNKGGKYIVDVAKKLINRGINAKVMVAASSGTFDCELPKNVEYIGRVSDQNKMAQLYSQADLTLVLSKRETFSMPVAESLCCGTPVSGFKSGGPECIALREYSCFVDYGDVDTLVDKICGQVYNINANLKKHISEAAATKYSQDRMCKEYLDIYKQFLGGM